MASFSGSFSSGSFSTDGAPEAPASNIVVGDGGLPWADEVRARFRKRQLEGRIAKVRREETKLVKEEAKILRKVESEKRQAHPVEGILAKYWLVTQKIETKRAEIKKLEIEFRQIAHYLDDEDDIEALLLS